MHRGFKILLALATGLAVTSPAMAQTPDENSAVTYFKMFFLTENLVGQLLIILLFLASLLTVAYITKLMIVYRRAILIPPELYQELDGKIAQKKYPEAVRVASESEAYLGKLVGGAMREAPNGYGAMERAIGELSDAETSRMLRPIEYLNVIGNVSPMLGLFGTVYGMIVAFQALVEAGRPEPQELAAGISTALVTTLWGLVVAIPALAGYALVRNKVDALTSDGLVMAEQLIRPFKPGTSKTTASSDA